MAALELLLYDGDFLLCSTEGANCSGAENEFILYEGEGSLDCCCPEEGCCEVLCRQEYIYVDVTIHTTGGDVTGTLIMVALDVPIGDAACTFATFHGEGDPRNDIIVGDFEVKLQFACVGLINPGLQATLTLGYPTDTCESTADEEFSGYPASCCPIEHEVSFTFPVSSPICAPATGVTVVFRTEGECL